MCKFIVKLDAKYEYRLQSHRLHTAILEAQLKYGLGRVAYGVGYGFPCIVEVER